MTFDNDLIKLLVELEHDPQLQQQVARDLQQQVARDMDEQVASDLYKPIGNLDSPVQLSISPIPMSDRERWEGRMRVGGWRLIRSWSQAMHLVRRQVKKSTAQAMRLRSGGSVGDADKECCHAVVVIELLQPGNWVQFTKVTSKADSHKVMVVAVSPWGADYRRELQGRRR